MTDEQLAAAGEKLERKQREVAEEYVSTWKKILRLRDWKIELRVESLSECDAKIHPLWESRQARLVVNKWQCMIPDSNWIFHETHDQGFEMEDAVVHELLHLYFWYGSRDESREKLAAEQGINHISSLLVRLRREGKL